MTSSNRVEHISGVAPSRGRISWPLVTALVFVAILLVGFALTTVRHGRFTARSYLRVAMQEKPIAFRTDNQTVDRDRFEIYKNTQQQLVLSRFVLLAALRRPEVVRLPSVQQAQKSGDVVNWLTRRLSVTFPGNAEIMEVSLNGDDPQEAATLNRAVVDAYLAEVVNAERDLKKGRLSELDRAYVEKETEIRSKREDLKKLAETLGTSDTETLTVKQKMALEELSIYRQDLAKSQSELRRLRSEWAAQQSMLKGIDALDIDDEVELAMQTDPIARQLFVDLELRKMEQIYREDAPGAAEKPERAERLQKDIKSLQAQYAARRAKLGELVRTKKRLAVRAEMRRLETTIAALTEQEQSQQKAMQEQQKDAERFGTSSVDVEMMRADIKNLDAVLTGIATEREKLRIEVRSAPRVTLIQRADVPEEPD